MAGSQSPITGGSAFFTLSNFSQPARRVPKTKNINLRRI
jgi:hypothetical protein